MFHEITPALVEALIADPFYRSITDDFADDEAARKKALESYFHYSLAEASRTGRCIVAPNPKLGAAAWLLPRTDEVEAQESAAKAEFLRDCLPTRGYENYRSIVCFMAPLAKEVVAPGSWYLSIVGVSPAAQGQGLGHQLLQPTLHEADERGVSCYLETFTPRNIRFYKRLGFERVATHLEPTTASEYVILSRPAPCRPIKG